MLTITRLDNDRLALDDDGDKLTGKFYSDGSGKLIGDNAASRFERLRKKYGKPQLSRAIQTAVRDGSCAAEAL